MKVHVSLNVKDLNKSVVFYKKMLSVDPVKQINAEGGTDVVSDCNKKGGYAKFDLAQPKLNLTLNEVDYEAGGSLSHLGLQVETTEEVLKFRDKWIEAELLTVDEMEVACCYAKQDKTWVTDPDGNEWEAFVVLEDLVPKTGIESCDCSTKAGEYVDSLTKNSTAAKSANETIEGVEACC